MQLIMLSDLLMLNANFNSISAIWWREQILFYSLDTYNILGNKANLYIKQLRYMYISKKN
jgi:hypothetical protein